jgi:hypothetical protein
MVYIFIVNDLKLFFYQVININTNKNRLDLITYDEIKLILKYVDQVNLTILSINLKKQIY